MMDIQKERKAFEQHLTDTGLVEFTGYGFAVDECDEYLHEPTQVAWDSWLIGLNRAKAQAVPEGLILVEKKNTEDWYLDDCEGMWWDHDGIDGSLCELDIGEVQAVEHKEYLITENNTLYATRVWDDANDQVDCWQFFKTKEEAEKAAAYCKAKFYEEAQEPTND